MALTNTTVKATYTGNAVTTTFAIPFTVIVDDSTETKVYIRDTSLASPTSTLKTEGALNDYTIVGNNVVFNASAIPSATNQVIIIRSIAKTQTLDLNPSGATPPAALELAMDRIAAQVQELGERVSRMPTLPITAQVTEANMALPEPLASQLIGWNAAGTALASYTPAAIAEAGAAGIASTTDLPEGTNLYHTTARVLAASNPMTTLGDIVRGAASGVVQRLAIGTEGHVLTVTSGLPAWAVTTPATGTYRAMTVTGTLSATSDHFTSCSGASYVVNLPTAIGNGGKIYRITHAGTSLSQVYTITPFGAETINGAATYALYTYGESVELVSTNTVWIVNTRSANTAWASWTPTYVALGTVATSTAFWRRNGDTMDIQYSWTNGTVTGSIASVDIPASATIKAAAIGRANTSGNPGNIVGSYSGNSANLSGSMVTATGTSSLLLYFGGIKTSAVMLTPAVGTILVNSIVYSAIVNGLPITGWNP